MTAVASRTPRIGCLLVAALLLSVNAQAQQPEAAPRKDPVPLDTTTIKGQQGLPKVMNIVPWKRPPAADPSGRPAVSLVDDALTPLDRGELRRELRYEHDLQAAATATASSETQSKEQ